MMALIQKKGMCIVINNTIIVYCLGSLAYIIIAFFKLISSTSEHNEKVKEMIKENILHQPSCKYSEDTVTGVYLLL